METAIELEHYIAETLPEFSGICREQDCRNAYDVARQLIRYTRNQLNHQNYLTAQSCFSMAEEMYGNGSKTVKNAIENVFVFSFSHTLFQEEGAKNKVWLMMPTVLRDIYNHQVLASHL